MYHKDIAVYVRTAQESNEQVVEQLNKIMLHLNRLSRVVPLKITEYIDNGCPGVSTCRPALNALRKQVAEGLVDMVIVASLDRLSRDVSVQSILVHELEENGAVVESCAEPEVTAEQPDDEDTEVNYVIRLVIKCNQIN